MRPATRLTWLRGFNQSAVLAVCVTLTQWGDQVFTPHTKLDRIRVLLSSKLPATGLNWRAGRLHMAQHDSLQQTLTQMTNSSRVGHIEQVAMPGERQLSSCGAPMCPACIAVGAHWACAGWKSAHEASSQRARAFTDVQYSLEARI